MSYLNPSDNPELADSMLETLDDLCKELGLAFFLAAGTCLGFYRDGDYIEGDTDIDVYIVASHGEWHDLWNALVGSGFDGHRGLRKGNIQLDLMRVDKEPPYILNAFGKNRGRCTFQDFDTILHYGRSYKVPGPVEEYLECAYGGELWRTPMSYEAWEKLKEPMWQEAVKAGRQSQERHPQPR